MVEKKKIGTIVQKPTTASLLDDMEKRIGNLLREEKSEKPQTIESILETVDELMAIMNKSKDKLQRRRLQAKCAELLDLAAKLKAKKKRKTVTFEKPNKHDMQQAKPADGVSPEEDKSEKQKTTTTVPVKLRPKVASSATAKNSQPECSLAKLSTKEKIILFKASRLGNFNAPPWENAPAATEFIGDPFTDPSGMLHLSDHQKRKLESWKRSTPTVVNPVGEIKLSLDLRQEAITDCSVVASMCVAFNMEERGFPRILSNRIYPQDDQGIPIPSSNGKYIVKLFLNGCYRKVVIDDFLPESLPEYKALHVVCRSDPSIVWPALIEKAYLKVGGGYDFPGSNCAMDLYALTGWFPEQIHLQSNDITRRELWALVYKNWIQGNVLMTLGTGYMPKYVADSLGLVPLHDYAVLNMKEDPETRERLIFVKNPWSEGANWRTYESDGDSSSSSDRDFDAGSDDDYNDDDDDDDDDDSDRSDGENNSISARKANKDDSNGTFWIDLNSVFIHFRSVYLNWNPKNFEFRRDHHFTWNTASRKSDTTFLDHPQFSIHNRSKFAVPVWVLLERHVGERQRHPTEEDPWGNLTEGPKRYISLYAYEASEGKRVILPGEATSKGPFVDTLQTLLRIDKVFPGQAITVVVNVDDFPAEEVSFTMTAFSLVSIDLGLAEEPFAYGTRISGNWTALTAGGHTESPKFPYNPQYNLKLTKDIPSRIMTNVSVVLESRKELAVNAVLLWNDGRRSFSIDTRSVLGGFTGYERGFSVSKADILPVPGEYTIVCSSLRNEDVGDFALTVKSNAPVELIRIPDEEEGKTKKLLFGSWGSCARIEYPISVKRPTRISASACLRGPGSDIKPLPAMKIAVEMRKPPNGAFERTACSGYDKFTASPQGVRTGEFTLQPGTMAWIVLQRPGDNRLNLSYQLIVLSDGPVTFSEKVLNYS
ncbi:cysteine proteinase [Ascobolus immersus RN42]|uniref:Cysteine proteinase n=1 Tax=Ascobolus immersus RN42 TaxID=1160509 RepID=A0A3N4IQ97_ASCIM|nr:cysteine proteinase [Ascobolus immersus RN42]